MKKDLIEDVINNFKIDGEVVSINSYGNGLINTTFLVRTTKNEYILQKINHYVFKKPSELMENVEKVTNYIIDNNGSTIKIIKTLDNNNYIFKDNLYFRCYEMKKHFISYEKIPNLNIALKTGKIMAEFQNKLKFLDPNSLNITIPFFHDLRHRYIDLIKAYRKCLDVGKKLECKNIISYFLNEYNNIISLPLLVEQSKIIKRVCHYDTKLNNFLFYKSNEKNGCLIDLDTVMPGCSLYDYGDNIRNTIVNLEEDDFKKEVKLDLKFFANITIGFLSIGKNYLSILEIDNLVESIKVIIIELSIRFLTDYLNNNVYFKIDYDKQNYNRSICQLNIYKKVKENENLLNNIIREAYNRII